MIALSHWRGQLMLRHWKAAPVDRVPDAVRELLEHTQPVGDERVIVQSVALRLADGTTLEYRP